MARGSFRLDLKRDDPRTLMLKIDRRSTFGGRERHHSYRLEADRELRHLDCAKRLSEASFKRSHREMSKKNEHLRGMAEQVRLRRENIEADLMHRTPAERMGRIDPHFLPYLRESIPTKTVPSMEDSIRRGPATFVAKSFLNDHGRRSLDHELTPSYRRKVRGIRKQNLPAKHGAKRISLDDMKARELAKLDETRAKIKAICHNTTIHTKPGDYSGNKQQYTNSRLNPIGQNGTIVTQKECDDMLTSWRQDDHNVSTGLHADTNQHQGNIQTALPKFKLPPLPIQTVVDPPTPELPEKHEKPRFAVRLPPQLTPVEYHRERASPNPFITPDFKPRASRQSELRRSSKKDEMYRWLGFESKDAFNEAGRTKLPKIDDPPRNGRERGSKGDDEPDIGVQ